MVYSLGSPHSAKPIKVSWYDAIALHLGTPNLLEADANGGIMDTTQRAVPEGYSPTRRHSCS